MLLSFPFTNIIETRNRPALVLLDTGDADIVVARITSQPARTTHDTVILEWQGAGLLLPSIARLDKLATLGKGLVSRRLGALAPVDEARVMESLRSLWQLH